MSINIWTDSMQHAALLGKPVLFTNWLIQRDIIPDGWYCYDLRGTHKSPSTRTTLVDHAADYHAGTVLSPIPLKHEGTASRRVNGTFYLLGEEMTLEQFCEEHDLAYPQDNREFVLRPASLDEVGLFYSEEKLDEALGTVGHLRMDFGHGEKEFWHTWWPHNEDKRVHPSKKQPVASCIAMTPPGIMILPSSHSPHRNGDQAMRAADRDPAGGESPMTR